MLKTLLFLSFPFFTLLHYEGSCFSDQTGPTRLRVAFPYLIQKLYCLECVRKSIELVKGFEPPSKKLPVLRCCAFGGHNKSRPDKHLLPGATLGIGFGRLLELLNLTDGRGWILRAEGPAEIDAVGLLYLALDVLQTGRVLGVEPRTAP